MQDVAPELLKVIKEDFENSFNKSEIIINLYEKVRDGTATYTEANAFALETGELLANVFKRNISSDVLPDGKMYYNIGKRVIELMLTEDYNLVSDVCRQVQTVLNKKANIGMKAMVPELNKDRIDGIINRLSSEENYDDVAWMLDEPIRNYSQSIVDDSIRKNAEFQYNSGMQPKIVRKLVGGCCDWCRTVSGTYKYPEVPDDVYRRHQRCRCTVEYDPRNGKVQNVHTKKWKSQENNEKIELRKSIGKKHETNAQKKEYRKYVGKYNLSYKESRALINYISPDSYVLNDKLRRGESLTEIEQEWIIELDRALNKLPVYKGNLNRSLIFRNDFEAKMLYEDFVIGDKYIPKQYLSATKQGIYDEEAQIQFYIQNSQKGRDLKGFNDMEHEVIYPTGSEFKVVNKVEVDGKYYILLEEV